MFKTAALKAFFAKNRIILIAVSAFAIVLSAVIVFSVSGGEDAPVADPIPEPEVVVSAEEGIPGCGLYVDGEFIAAFTDGELLRDAVDEYVSATGSSYSALVSAENVIYNINNEIEYVDGLYPADSFVVTGDIAACLEGVVSVEAKGITSVETVLDHSVRNVYTDNYISGKTYVTVAGQDGLAVDKYEVTVSGGEVISTELVSSEVVAEPVDEVVEIGTFVTSKTKTTASIGVFIKPYNGTITSGFGTRWGKLHRGIDIAKADCAGDPAVAAADGIVTVAEWHESYGNYVVIDHGDGIETYYAHFSEICVKVGQVVKAGDVVGKIGMTGHATGYHLHFEVRVNGENVNPLLFVKY